MAGRVSSVRIATRGDICKFYFVGIVGCVMVGAMFLLLLSSETIAFCLPLLIVCIAVMIFFIIKIIIRLRDDSVVNLYIVTYLKGGASLVKGEALGIPNEIKDLDEVQLHYLKNGNRPPYNYKKWGKPGSKNRFY